MKKLLTIAMAFLLLAACQSSDKRYTQDAPEIDTMKELIKAYNTKNYDSQLIGYADTAKIYHNTKSLAIKPSQLAAAHGQNDINFTTRGFLDEGQDYEKVVTDDGHVWVNFWGTWEGTMGVSNEKLQLTVHLTNRFVDGKVVEEHGYWDTAPLVAAVENVQTILENGEGYKSNAAIIRSVYQFFADGDIPSFLDLLDPKVEWNEAENFIYADKSPYIGPQAFVDGVLARIGEDWEYWNIADLTVTGMENNMVLGTGRYQAKHKVTGKIINAQVSHLFTLRNGKIVKFQQYTDTKQVAEAVQ